MRRKDGGGGGGGHSSLCVYFIVQIPPIGDWILQCVPERSAEPRPSWQWFCKLDLVLSDVAATNESELVELVFSHFAYGGKNAHGTPKMQYFAMSKNPVLYQSEDCC